MHNGPGSAERSDADVISATHLPAPSSLHTTLLVRHTEGIFAVDSSNPRVSGRGATAETDHRSREIGRCGSFLPKMAGTRKK